MTISRIEIGSFTETFRWGGVLVLSPDKGLEWVFDSCPRKVYVEMKGDYVPYQMLWAKRYAHKSKGYLVKLQFVDTYSEASQLVMHSLYCELEREKVFAKRPLMGYAAKSPEGKNLGVVTGISTSKLQQWMELEQPSGKVSLIPFAEIFITEVDDDKQFIILDLPIGLLDLD